MAWRNSRNLRHIACHFMRPHMRVSALRIGICFGDFRARPKTSQRLQKATRSPCVLRSSTRQPEPQVANHDAGWITTGRKKSDLRAVARWLWRHPKSSTILARQALIQTAGRTHAQMRPDFTPKHSVPFRRLAGAPQ